MAKKFSWFLFLFCSSVLTPIEAQFELQFIGDYVSLDDEAQRQFCDTKNCLLDANNLFHAATQNLSVHPCIDFKEFSLGTFVKYRAINDRDRYNGFLLDVQNAHHERQRKILSAKIDSKDTQLTKNMKNFFSKCVNSSYIRSHGVQEMRDYLKLFGLHFHPEINQSDFNLTNLFENLPEQAISVFLRQQLKRCTNNKREYLCLRTEFLSNPEIWYAGYEGMLFEINRFVNTSFPDAFKEEFRNIAFTQYVFYKLQVRR